MTLVDYFAESYIELGEDEAHWLSKNPADQYVVEVQPPRTGDIPSTLNRFVRNVMELQSKWLGLVNTSPRICFEIRRSNPEKLQLQYSAPTKRLERKIRTHLTEEIPGISFSQGTSGLPVAEDTTVGGGLLTVGRSDYHPLRTEFDRPPMNSVISALHRDAMQDSKFIIQILFQPIAGHPVRDRLWRHRAYKQIGYLRKEKPGKLPWVDRPATRQEKKQADQIEGKARSPRFHTAIRILTIDAGEFTRSRVKEVAGSFNVYEDPVSNQYLDTVTVTRYLPRRFTDFADAARKRSLDTWTLPFQATADELAALVSLPSQQQQNIQYSNP